MVAKIILTVDGTVLQELPLLKERITIGRRSHNDIVIDDLAISAEHAVIVTILKDSFLEDLNSTNGTQINGQPVKKHFLQDNDVIELAHYRLSYLSDVPLKRSDMNVQIFSQCSGIAAHGQGPQLGNERAVPEKSGLKHMAAIKILNGYCSGKEIPLIKALTTIGRPGVQVAAITHRPEGYRLTHVEGNIYPIVNGRSIGAGTHNMVHGDVIDLSGTQIAFLLT